jgi:predicted Zn-dependent peptidase
VLTIVGELDADEAEKYVNEYLGQWQEPEQGAQPSVGSGPPPLAEHPVLVVHKPKATQADINVGCRLAEVDEQRSVAYRFTASLLSDELMRMIREQAGASYGIYARYSSQRDGSAQLQIGGQVENAKVAFALDTINKFLDKLATDGVDKGLFARIHWETAQQFNLGFATTGAVTGTLIGTLLRGWPIEAVDHYPQNLAKVTPEQVKEVIATCRENEMAVIVGDEKVVRAALQEAGIGASLK